MHMVVANSAFDLTLPRYVPASHSTLQGVLKGMRLLGVAAQSVLFFAVLWLLTAAPGFLSARDSLMPAETGRVAHQASR